MALPAGRRGVRPDQVKPDGTLNVTEPTPYTLPTASADTLGGVKVGTGLSITDGVLSATEPTPYTLPTASADTLGGVKVGSGLSIADGVLSASGGRTIYTYEHTFNNRSYTSLKIDGNELDVPLTDIPANAVIVSAMMKPNVGTEAGSPQMVYPLLGRWPDGRVHIGLANMYDGSVTFSGKIIIKYYLEEVS